MAKIILGGRRVEKKPVKKTSSPVSLKEPKEDKKGLTGLSIRQILKATPPLFKNNAQEVIIRSLREVTTKGGFPGIRAKATSVGGKSKHVVHDLSIIGKERDLPLSKQKHVLVSCDCENFCFYWEVALHHWGSAVIKYSNGEHPEVTNPSLLPGCCKHLVKLAKTIIEKGL